LGVIGGYWGVLGGIGAALWVVGGGVGGGGGGGGEVWTKCVLGDVKELSIQSLHNLETSSFHRANLLELTSAHT